MTTYYENRFRLIKYASTTTKKKKKTPKKQEKELRKENICLLISFNTRKDGELVTTRAILGQDLVTAGERGVVEEAIKGSDGFGANQANALNVPHILCYFGLVFN